MVDRTEYGISLSTKPRDCLRCHLFFCQFLYITVPGQVDLPIVDCTDHSACTLNICGQGCKMLVSWAESEESSWSDSVMQISDIKPLSCLHFHWHNLSVRAGSRLVHPACNLSHFHLVNVPSALECWPWPFNPNCQTHNWAIFCIVLTGMYHQGVERSKINPAHNTWESFVMCLQLLLVGPWGWEGGLSTL